MFSERTSVTMTIRTPSAARTLPDVYDWLGRLTPNALQLILGVDESGEPSLCRLDEASPLRIQGRPQARDRVVFTLLAQLFSRNDPDALRVVLLDPRPYFSTLFRQHAQVRLIANTRPMLIQTLHMLHQEHERRSSQPSGTPPPWLIFIEEDPGLYQDELTWRAFHALVAQGHEVGLHLLVASSGEGGLEDALEALPPFRSRITCADDEQAEQVRPPDAADQGFTLERETDPNVRFLLPPSFDTRLLVHLAQAAQD
jgi:hypothetical protein